MTKADYHEIEKLWHLARLEVDKEIAALKQQIIAHKLQRSAVHLHPDVLHDLIDDYKKQI